MKPTDKLIEANVQHFCDKWNWTKDSGLTFDDKASVVKIEKWLLDSFKQVAEAARAERDKEILGKLPNGLLMCQPFAYQRKHYSKGFWDCYDQVKAILSSNNNEAHED